MRFMRLGILLLAMTFVFSSIAVAQTGPYCGPTPGPYCGPVVRQCAPAPAPTCCYTPPTCGYKVVTVMKPFTVNKECTVMRPYTVCGPCCTRMVCYRPQKVVQKCLVYRPVKVCVPCCP